MGERKNNRGVETKYYVTNPQECGKVKVPELQRHVVTMYGLQNFHHHFEEEYQAGCRPGRSTTDQIFTVKRMLEKCWEYNINVYLAFIDFRKAYDSVGREKKRGIF